MEGLNEVGHFLAGCCMTSLPRPLPFLLFGLHTVLSVIPVSHASLQSPSLQSFLYSESTDFITYSDFINKELILFSNMDNERSIPSMVDGGLQCDQSKVVSSMMMMYTVIILISNRTVGN